MEVNFKIALSSYENLTYEEKFNLDLKMCEYLAKSGNMFEGIRAYFIEKYKKPLWRVKF